MSILTTDELREHIETALGDDALQRLLDAAEELIVARAGTTGQRVEIVGGGDRFLALSKRVDTVASITELVGTTTYTLAADDWLQRDGDMLLERLQYGTNPSSYWRGQVTVTYTPVSDDATRKKVQIDLCQLAITYQPGISEEDIGEWRQVFTTSNSAWNVTEEREAILSQLDVSLGMVVIG